MHVIGQKHNLELINNWETLPNFIIIQGDKDTGKTYMVKYLCDKFDKNYHLMGNSIQEIRKLINLMVEGSDTVFHFKDFDKASIQAKNALLKITEEPVMGNHIVITGSAQLQTLESRARRLQMEPYDYIDLQMMIRENYADVDTRKLFIAGFNTPSKINLYKSYESLNGVLKYAFEIFNEITHLTIDNVLQIMNSFEIRYDEVDGVDLFLSMLINIIEYNMREKLKFKFSYYETLDLLLNARDVLRREPTLNRKLLLYRTFYNIKLCGGSI